MLSNSQTVFRLFLALILAGLIDLEREAEEIAGIKKAVWR